MKGLEAWIWIGCICMGITQTVPTLHITQSLSSSLSKIIHRTNSSSVSDLSQRNYANTQLFTRIMGHRDQHDKVTGYNHAVNGSTNMAAMPNSATFSVGKRSVKRGEVDYFENLTSQAMPSNSSEQAFKNMSRHKRMSKKTSKGVVQNEQERKQQTQEEAEHRRKESALRRKEVREGKLVNIKNRRLQLKNTRKSAGTSHIRERQSISKKMLDSRGKMRINNGPQRPYKSSSHIGLLIKRKSRLMEKAGQYGKNNCRKSIIEKKHKSKMNLREKQCVFRGNPRNHNDEEQSSKVLARKQSTRFDDKSERSKSSSDSKNNTSKKGRKHPEKNSKEYEISMVKDQDSMKRTTNDNKSVRKKQKPSKSKTLDNETHRNTGKRGNKSKAKEEDKHKHSGKESDSKKPNKNKKVHQKGGPKNKKSYKNIKIQKNKIDKKEQAKGKVPLRKGGKVSKSKNKSTKKHLTVVTGDSEEKSNEGEVSGEKHEYKKEGRKQGNVKKLERLEEKDSDNVDGVERSKLEKSSKHEVDYSVKKSKSVKMTKKPRKVDKKLTPIHENNEGKNKNEEGNQTRKSKKGRISKEVSAGKAGVEKNVSEIEYLGHVLGFGLGNRKHSQSKSRAWTGRVHKRPMTGGYASSGRLTRALSNLYGASASAGF